ncbi:dimethylargininase [Ruicaihuangia caeni]|uniref:Arginine deiminase-related protein n=1 Tax=Ruicaihuangia caeni TaxID=3042517 RepID=A0AAW6TAG8_9MICO|nr:dimethylargininase [Klugiella sp. YN-L-19]MDI2098978.1 arginine deiminase-related protein [Klugiella sp. YN-L-19]
MTLTRPASAAAHREAVPRRVLMCRPTWFTVAYRINPWMHPEQHTDRELAMRQWQHLYDTYRSLGFEVELIDPVEELPDMVYAANGGFVIDGVAYGASFVYPERQPEAQWYNEWFKQNGFELREPRHINEGEGDFLLVGGVILAGTGFRSDSSSHAEVAAAFNREVITLRLVDPSFYHLDTAVAVLDSTAAGPAAIAFLPEAFDEASQATLRERFPGAIEVDRASADVFGLNAFSDGKNVVVAAQATSMHEQLKDAGYTPVPVDLSELKRGGGGIKCCTLELR